MRPQGKNNNKPLVLGIDPGSRFCGYGIIDSAGAYVTSGTIVLGEGRPLPERLRDLHAELTAIIAEFGPSSAAVEKVFFANSVKSALTLGHARGVALLAAASGGLSLFEYSPLEVKKAVTGYGRAGKPQVQAMVRNMLSLRFDPSPDGADALAVAICHMNHVKYAEAISKQ